ncbi:MAG: sialidase family protein [Planctomycetaceae bacterium]
MKPCVRVLSFLAMAGLYGDAYGLEIVVPSIPGLKVTRGESVAIRDAESAIVHRFEDGRIVVMGKDCGIWSNDDGKTWSRGPKGPDDKTTLNLGNGEVLSIRRTSTKAKDGTFSLSQRRSLDGWKSVVEETAPLDTPNATTAGGDAGDQHEGLLMHHGALQLPSGELVATMFGNYHGDRIPAGGYPEELKLFKYRTVVVFSSDKGRSWGNPVTVAYDKQLARGADPDSSVQTTAVVPAVTQEGFCEADLTRATDGTLICAMRSGGRIGIRRVPIFPTPLYVSRSTDDGRSWSAPVPIADRGVCPYLVTLNNGVIVCSYARPGGWLIFSDDRGETWKGAFQISSSDSYCNVIEVSPNRLLAIYYDRKPDPNGGNRDQTVEYWGTFFTVDRR